MGITTLDRADGWYGLSLALGGGSNAARPHDRTTPCQSRQLFAASPYGRADRRPGPTETPDLRQEVPVISPAAAFQCRHSQRQRRPTPCLAPTACSCSASRRPSDQDHNDLRDNWTIVYRFLVTGVWASSSGHPMRRHRNQRRSIGRPLWAVLAIIVMAMLDHPADPQRGISIPAGVQQLDRCPPASVAGGQQCFTQAWLQQTEGEPLRDSIARTFAPVYIERKGQRRQIGFCSAPLPSGGASRCSARPTAWRGSWGQPGEPEKSGG
jgi:hypothetical protein